ncbi:Zinc ion binding [Tyrophagus putrescentiae]|nr:Zinc ion binding [Tyrophagus putrescentiae]
MNSAASSSQLDQSDHQQQPQQQQQPLEQEHDHQEQDNPDGHSNWNDTLDAQQQHLINWLNNLSLNRGNPEEDHAGTVQPPPEVDSLEQNDENSWYHFSHFSERIKLILALIKSPDLGALISPPLKRKLTALSKCQLSDNRERMKTMRTAISIGNRILCELLLKHTDSQQMVSSLWNAVRNRGCQFLGPAIQEEILKLVLLALEDGEALTRKVLILFVMQRLSPHYPYQSSKTAIGHVIQILYRASCFELIKREGDSSLMQLKQEYRTYESLRREHDTQIVSIAMEAGLRISPEQWSSMLYGDYNHKSQMQSIIDRLQAIKPSFGKLIDKFRYTLSKQEDPVQLMDAVTFFEQLAYFETSLAQENVCTLEHISIGIDAVNFITIKMLTYLRYVQQKERPETSIFI